MLAGFIGFGVIRRVSPLLHTPLMSITNALDAISGSRGNYFAANIKPTSPPCSEPSPSLPPQILGAANKGVVVPG
jgi:hypothetical protein